MCIISIENIKEIIDNWDPIDLLPFAPPDEYDPETKKIYTAIKNSDNLDANYLGEIIYNVFIKAFGNDVFFKSLDECKSVAKNIIQVKK